MVSPSPRLTDFRERERTAKAGEIRIGELMIGPYGDFVMVWNRPGRGVFDIQVAPRPENVSCRILA